MFLIRNFSSFVVPLQMWCHLSCWRSFSWFNLRSLTMICPRVSEFHLPSWLYRSIVFFFLQMWTFSSFCFSNASYALTSSLLLGCWQYKFLYSDRILKPFSPSVFSLFSLLFRLGNFYSIYKSTDSLPFNHLF